MNNWKIAFWCCLTVLLLVIGFSVYAIIDQSVTLSYQKEGYKYTENDLDAIIQIINKTDLTKGQIETQIKNNTGYEYIDFKTDTILLDRISLEFNDNKLKAIKKQW